MKKIFPVLFLSMICILMTACGANNEKSNIDINSISGISLSVKDVTSTGLTYIVTNDTDAKCTFGDMYQIERKENDEWYILDALIEDPAWYSILRIVEPGTHNEYSVDWEYLYGSLEKGTYRIIKTVNDSISIAASFEVG